ncbi:MAG: type IVB secretion system protein IcmH/DotU [Gammaproteobacteria bacterium]
MSSDKDKTVFRNPSGQTPAASGRGGGDRTVIRPTPGGRGQAPARGPDATQQRVPPGAAPAPRPISHAAYRDPDSAQFKTQYGLNPIVNAASMLIGVFYKTRQTVSHPNVGGLYQQLIQAIRAFEAALKEKNVAPETVLAARYVVCTALDEIVLSMPWGAESGWGQRTLLSTFHNETHGGEKFFLLLDKMKERPREHLDMLELMYIFLSLGYEGRYRLSTRGRDMVEKIRDELFQIIRTHRGEYERSLSSHWQGLGKMKNTLTQYVPLWVVASVLAGVLTLAYSGFRVWMYQSADDVVRQLDQIATSATPEKGRIGR